MPSNKINVRDRLEDGELDLSMSDLDEVPVRDIAVIKKATTLDLSNNRLTSLGRNFATLTHIIKLDLSSNLLTELPENFGDLTQLKHLDLYNNQITHLPLSLGQLKALRWLDLKNNPLVPALAEVVGQCLDAQQCQQSARKVVTFLQRMQEQVTEERLRRQQQKKKQQELAELAAQEKKKEQQQQKKKKKASKTNDKIQTKQENGLKSHAVHSGEGLNSHKKDTVKLNNNKLSKTSARRFSVMGILGSLLKFILYAALLVGLVSFTLAMMNNEQISLVQGTATRLSNQILELLPLPLREGVHHLADTLRPKALEFGNYIYNATLHGYSYVGSTYDWLRTDETIQQFLSNLRSFWDGLCIGVGEAYRTISHHALLYVEIVKKKLL